MVLRLFFILDARLEPTFAKYREVPNSCAVRNNSVGWKIHPN